MPKDVALQMCCSKVDSPVLNVVVEAFFTVSMLMEASTKRDGLLGFKLGPLGPRDNFVRKASFYNLIHATNQRINSGLLHCVHFFFFFLEKELVDVMGQ